MARKPARPDESSFRHVYRNYKARALRKGIKFSISRRRFRELTQERCYLCGSEPGNSLQAVGGKAPFAYNGIDRIESTAGYVPHNVRPCCWKCNNIKARHTIPELISHILKIFSHLTLQGVEHGAPILRKQEKQHKPRG